MFSSDGKLAGSAAAADTLEGESIKLGSLIVL
jgi:hypothetical protein